MALRRLSVDLASAAAGMLGSLANTVGVLGLAVLFGLLPLSVIPAIVPQAIAEAVLAAVVTVVVVRGVMLFRSGRTTAPEVEPDQENATRKPAGAGMIELEGVSFTYRTGEGDAVPALRGLDLAFEPGQFVAIIGHNGSGKSTLVKLLTAILYPTEGEIRIDGVGRAPRRTSGRSGRRCRSSSRTPTTSSS